MLEREQEISPAGELSWNYWNDSHTNKVKPFTALGVKC